MILVSGSLRIKLFFLLFLHECCQGSPHFAGGGTHQCSETFPFLGSSSCITASCFPSSCVSLDFAEQVLASSSFRGDSGTMVDSVWSLTRTFCTFHVRISVGVRFSSDLLCLSVRHDSSPQMQGAWNSPPTWRLHQQVKLGIQATGKTPLTVWTF